MHGAVFLPLPLPLPIQLLLGHVGFALTIRGIKIPTWLRPHKPGVPAGSGDAEAIGSMNACPGFVAGAGFKVTSTFLLVEGFQPSFASLVAWSV
jgi:hypothetical protein